MYFLTCDDNTPDTVWVAELSARMVGELLGPHEVGEVVEVQGVILHPVRGTCEPRRYTNL